MLVSDLKHGNVRKIVADPTSGDVHVITPIFPIGKITNHKELIRRWGVTEVVSKVYKNLQRAVGKADLTLMKTLDDHFAHPTKDGSDQFENYTYQSHYSLGKLAHVYPTPDKDKVMWGAYKVLDPVAKKVTLEYMDSYNKGIVPLYSSSQIVNSASENPYSIENFDLMHTTLTDNPSFGKELTKIGAVCQGNTQQCTLQIRTASNIIPADVRVNTADKIISIFHETCPFCVETELRELFKKNSFLMMNRASNIKMVKENEKPEDTKETPDATKLVMPDADQQKDNSSLDPEKLADTISSKIAENFKKSNVTDKEDDEKPAETKEKETPKDDKKEKEIVAEELKPFNIEDTPQYKAMMKRLEKTEKALADSKVDKEELKTLKNEQNFTKIGSLLAKYESNFVNPEDGKPDPKAFDKAFEFLRNTDWSVDDIETVLKMVSPYGTIEHKKSTTVAPESVIQKASKNRGVPKYDSAFEDKKEEIHEASDHKRISAGLSLVDSIGKLNEA